MFAGFQNGDEDGRDCGGSCGVPCPSCYDGVKNGREGGVDCAGECKAQCHDLCFDGLLNGWELAVRHGAVSKCVGAGAGAVVGVLKCLPPVTAGGLRWRLRALSVV